MKRFFPAQITLALLACTSLLLVFGCSNETPYEPESVNEDLIALEPPPTMPSPPALGDTLVYIETFETNKNEGKWSYYTPNRVVFEDLGGNPDGYLHDDNISSFAPHPGTGLGEESVFTGDYQAKRVISLGIDLRSLDYSWDITSRYVALMIMTDAGTPLDHEDDWGAYIVGPDKVPSKYLEMKSTADLNQPGWKSYDFAIGAQENILPEGWVMIRPISGVWDKAKASWGNLMRSVSYVQFWYGDPSMIYLLNDFDLGLDNPRIAWEN